MAASARSRSPARWSNSQSVILNGIVMVSPLLEEQYFFSDDPLTYAFTLPTLAAAALERDHKFSAEAVDAAYAYALGPYLTTIAGRPPEGDAATDFYQHVATITGLPDWGGAQGTRPAAPRMRTMCAARRAGSTACTKCRCRSRTRRRRASTARESPDPLLEGYGHAYGGAFAGYAADTLGFKTELTYRLLDEEVNRKMGLARGRPPRALHQQRFEEIAGAQPLVACADCARLFRYRVSVLRNPMAGYAPAGWSGSGNLKVYPGGHMLYTRPTSRAALASDVGQMVSSAAAPPAP
ncbi:MAG: hypothetical protein WDN04_20770 [Rhodospirillales bacterium]